MSYIELDNYSGSEQCSVAIGIFDGVHLGHQAVLSKTRAAADACGIAAVALTFEPHPLSLIAPDRAPRTICSFSQKTEWMTRPGLVETLVIAHFDRRFASLSPREFVEKVLVRRMNAREVRVGADFRFGHARAGGVMDLESLGEQYGFTVSIVHAISREGERISSSAIRNLVEAGRVAEASTLLGRPFTLRGEVVSGKQLGRTIGFPTANVKPEAPLQLLPRNGIYAGYGVVGGRRIRAALSVGTNPTTDGTDAPRKVEAFLMDGFSGDLYGRTLDLELIDRLRDERRFDSVDDLVMQMERDTIRAAEVVAPASL